jgi:hypothetical protein
VGEVTKDVRVRWLSTPPSKCEICGAPITRVFYDAATKRESKYHGMWACMCRQCFSVDPGIGILGVGRGQQYEKRGTGSNVEWVCVAGSSELTGE